MSSAGKIENFILDNLTKHQKDIVKTTIQKFGLSRPAILKHMHTLINSGLITFKGTTRDRTYTLLPSVDYVQTFIITPDLSIDELIQKEFLHQFTVIPKSVSDICDFGMTALLDNVVDHSQAKHFTIKLLVIDQKIKIQIMDDGVGIFKYIGQQMGLDNRRQSAIELAKGKLTTDPDHHAGDDLSVVMHLFDHVNIIANGIILSYDTQIDHWKLEKRNTELGTTINMEIDIRTKRTCVEVFNNVLINDNIIRIPVVLARTSDRKFLSRKQAEYVVSNISDLNRIEFDFNGVNIIGPAFADELIRKVKEKNRSIGIGWINTTDTVDVMMSRAAKRFPQQSL